jgi:co-chaperonin GroES (HSP10)
VAIKPLRDRIYVIPLKDPIKRGSLIMHEKVQQRVDQGIVKYRGEDVKEIKVGMHVLFAGYSGYRIAVEGEGELFVLKESDVMAIWAHNSEAQTLFTQQDILNWIDEAMRDLMAREDRPVVEVANKFEEVFKNYVENYFEREGLLF